ncbi:MULTISPECIES: ADP-ribosylglycohydrolase family protein [unclassified Streptomyces]|uniref:ADP-ribosylglycohydrolase family protein n=1 Tax=unclassified Streptomyces TaxID=2593676 RepID=UPI001BE7B7AB|nr:MULTISPECIES: ADP-ribosylglycohydrolase family protein [unclassified Streptomyces]MBT2407344.1 ADP-ribosylglycohydrolase family protein [Streptomyces sp. ISL-21]MBT2609714.1 ADP-ribosylglycohydrolase family protein [Streptomyces sp. ISL-87]
MTADSSPERRYARAMSSLRGLALGDALGSQYFVPVNYPLLKRRELPAGTEPWQWTDDTEMACSVVAVLAEHGRIDQDALAASFAHHHDFDRGYGPAVNRMLRLVREGEDWRTLAAELFNGQGSWGNGAAMRIAPLGAWYADDPEQATHQAEISAYTTHQHREAVCGAMAVAAATALAAAPAGPPKASDLLDGVIALVPRSAVGAGLRRARDMLDYGDATTVAAVLGCGRRTSAHDTVPFALWSAARALDDYERAFWTTAQVGGDVDTNCAIVGGVLGARGDEVLPQAWLARTEALPAWLPEAAAR